MAESPDEPPGAGAEEGTSPATPVQPSPAGPPAPQPQLPESPFSTETIEFMTSDERLAVILRGGAIGASSVPTAVAGPFLFRLHELLHAVAAVLAGRRPGSRGSLPPLRDVGLLALVGVQWGHSVTFHLEIGAGEQTHIAPAGTISSLSEEALALLSELVRYGASGDADALWNRTKDLGPRVGGNYERLIEVFVQQEIDTVWRFATDDRAVDLSSTRAHRAKELLDYEQLPVVFEQEVRGYLYRVDSREHAFLLDPEGEHEEKVTGTYPEHLREDLRDAWSREVVVKLRTTHRFLARQTEPSEVLYELIEVLEVLEL